MVRFNVTTPKGDPREWLRRSIDRIEGGNKYVLSSSIEDGASVMKDYISSRPTAWMEANRGKTGRIETGRMRDAVSSRVNRQSKYRWEGSFGWISTMEPYFLVQEEGGVNTFTGGRIQAMYAKQDAGEYVWNRVKAEIGAIIRGA